MSLDWEAVAIIDLIVPMVKESIDTARKRQLPLETVLLNDIEKKVRGAISTVRKINGSNDIVILDSAEEVVGQMSNISHFTELSISVKHQQDKDNKSENNNIDDHSKAKKHDQQRLRRPLSGSTKSACYNCNDYGHHRTDCPKPLRKDQYCFVCNTPGVTLRTCPLHAEWYEKQGGQFNAPTRNKNFKGTFNPVPGKSTVPGRPLHEEEWE